MALYKKITKCRSCGQKETLKPVLDLGKQELVYFADGNNNNIGKIPLQLVKCNNGDCHLVQLQHSVDRDLLFRNYFYKSGINQTMRDELKDIVQKAVKMARPKKGDMVVDIGANDGTLLSYYPDELYTVGYEPSSSLAKEAKKHADTIINDYYSSTTDDDDDDKVKIITAIAMFYDLDNPNEFLQHIKKNLDDDGLFIIQMNYLETMLKNNAFDNICHEHTCYYNLHSMIRLVTRNELEIFHVQTNDINGGSVRLYIKHKDCKRRAYWLRDSVFKYLVDEESIYTIKLQEFAQRIAKIKEQVQNTVYKLMDEDKFIYGYGASTRGAVLLQYFDLAHTKCIAKIADRNPEKWGKKYLGKIPVISELQMRIDNPDVLFVLPWYYEKEFISREMKEYLSRGNGTMMFPLPELHEIRPLPTPTQQQASISFCPRRRANAC